MGKLFEELKRRKVFRIAGVYAVVGWVLAQIAAFAVETFSAPQWVQQIFVVFLILGFPLAVILAWAYEVSPSGIKPDTGIPSEQSTTNSTDRKLIYATFILVLLAVGFQVADRFLLEPQVVAVDDSSNIVSDTISETGSNLTRRFEFNLGVTVPTIGALLNAEVVLSPDGKRLVFGLQRPGTPQQIYVQELDQLQAQLISGADGGDHPFISPDGEWIVYTATNSLRKISIRGGESLPVADSARQGGSGFWSSDDSIYYASDEIGSRQLMKVAGNGGEPETLLFESQTPGYEHAWPWLLPDGNSLLFTVSPFIARDGRISVLTISTGEVKTVIQNGYNARYVPTGHIVFIRAATLWAVPFDPQRLETLGQEVPVIQGIQTAGNNGSASYTFSNDGLLIYLPGEDTTEITEDSRTLLWVDRNGNEESLSLRRNFLRPVVSPDGQRLAVSINENDNEDIWVYDLARNTLSRLTFDAAFDRNPLWTPDGERIVFASNRDDGGLWWRAADGTGQAEPLLTGDINMTPYAFTPDGSQLAYSGLSDLFLLTLDGESPPLQLTETEFREWRPAISHDGRWIAYQSNETGRPEIYVRPFPEIETGKWQISNEGGEYPKWGPNDSEIIFRRSRVPGFTSESSIMASRVTTEPTFQNDAPITLFSGSYNVIGDTGGLDISADGSQFLLIRGADNLGASEQTRLIAVENWFEELKRLAPPDPQ